MVFNEQRVKGMYMSLSKEEKLYIEKEIKHEGNPWMMEEEVEHHFDERLEKLKRKRSRTWQPWPADDNKLTLECYEEEKKEDNHVSKMEIGISINEGIIDFKNLKFKDWLDVRYGNEQPKDLLGRARLFKKWVAKTVAIDGYMVIEEEPVVLDAQIGFMFEDLKRDGGVKVQTKVNVLHELRMYLIWLQISLGDNGRSFMIAMRISGDEDCIAFVLLEYDGLKRPVLGGASRPD
nr:hypothetical protein [Tanacetum cinerariifolium]